MKNAALIGACVVVLLAGACKNDPKELEKRVEILEQKVAALSTSNQARRLNENIVQSTNADPNSPLPVLEFKDKQFDFGTIKQGQVVRHTFTFENKGKAPLVVSNATASCGCTVPKWPDQPIEPGKNGEIEVMFDSKGKSGMQNKTVSITANTEPQITVLTFKAFVSGENSSGTH